MEYASMTEQDYVLLCVGAELKSQQNVKIHRATWWYSYIGSHVDPKSLPKSITDFMPLDGDNQSSIEPITIERLQEIDKLFRGLS